ncbi:MAG: cytochrome c maturation protein CcmE [Acidobacteria bacterium]|nr:cytochrome c maturation protein CcmE [Acidobacteriota bacterium]
MRPGRNKWQFGAGIVIILSTIAWLGYSGIQESKTYYVTVSELLAAPESQHRRFRVAGDVASGSIQRAVGRVEFRLQQGADLIPVVYTGVDPLPDTLVDGAQAVADGRFENGTFQAEAVQAKCASKYEAMEAEANAEAQKSGAR